MDLKLNKTELHAELIRINSRVNFLRAASLGAAIDKQYLAELLVLEKSREFVMSELKK
jgi:hypothetical protein